MQSTQNGNRLYPIIGLTSRRRRNSSWKTVIALYIYFVVLASLGVAYSAEHSFYVGISTSRQRLNAFYNKAVDNTAPTNTSTQ